MPRTTLLPHTLRGRVALATMAVLFAAPVLPATAGDSMPSQLHRLRVCESSDNYRTDTGNGYYGAYQFDAQTWHGLGERGRPDQASPATQDQAAVKLHSQRGWRPWPSCARKEHLS